jgi:hydrogenase maturation protein HypF
MSEIQVLDASAAECRAQIKVRGAVQGVGFRPHAYRLARGLGLHGNVHNSPEGVVIEVQGPSNGVNEFLRRLEPEKPAFAAISEIEIAFANPLDGETDFAIGASEAAGHKSAFIMADLATCRECRREIFDPENRRHRYPFTNCTHCGPRFSIIEALPYDRSNTAMREFRMCPQCESEYRDPMDRRFHAQPNACPLCGPQLAYRDIAGRPIAARAEALDLCASALRRGEIVAVKGIGGFQIMVDARNEHAVRRLRRRKNRPDKPFAVMFPTLEAIEAECLVCEAEQQLLLSEAAPITLLHKRQESFLADSVAPRNPYVGAMLPCSPLHHLLLEDLGFPVVATSGNLSEETLCTNGPEACRRLSGIVDAFLDHNRPIVRPVDDSVVRISAKKKMVLRRARGYAPMPVRILNPVAPMLAGGAFLKNCVALAFGKDVFLSQHIGDLGTPEAVATFRAASADLARLYSVIPKQAACDLHPDYPSTVLLRESFTEVTPVQHHHAHVLATMAEHGLEGPLLGVCWDGTGLGTDGTSWGGEFLEVERGRYRRIGHFRTFPLPGGDAAAREPRRSALGAAYAADGDGLFENAGDTVLSAFSSAELKVLRGALRRRVNTPLTSSAGRLFDAVASILKLRQSATYEGQAAMELEFAICDAEQDTYPFIIREGSPAVFDWQPTLEAARRDAQAGVGAGMVSARFHRTLIEVIAAFARKAGHRNVILCGGCFQNDWLLTHAAKRLRQDGFEPHWPQSVPLNDGGIALGQVMAISQRAQSLVNSD